jgi:hypothetical protein
MTNVLAKKIQVSKAILPDDISTPIPTVELPIHIGNNNKVTSKRTQFPLVNQVSSKHVTWVFGTMLSLIKQAVCGIKELILSMFSAENKGIRIALFN